MEAYEEKGTPSGRHEVSGQVRGSFRSVLLGWTDPISGERLRVRLRGGGRLAESLAPLGFEVLGREDLPGRADPAEGDPGAGERLAGEAPGRAGRILSFQPEGPSFQPKGSGPGRRRTVSLAVRPRAEGGSAAAG